MKTLLKRRMALLSCLTALLLTAELPATKLVQMNLDKLCADSARIFLGTVVGITEETVNAGGAELPSVKVLVRVDQAFKGQFTTIKGVQLTEIRMLGTSKILEGRRRSPIPSLPQMKMGGEYLLMVAPDGPIGLTSTMGLGQGCFDIETKGSVKTALNQFNNVGLFNGMNVSGMPSSGPVDYTALAQLVEQLVGGGN